jgi:hypothetical protein
LGYDAVPAAMGLEIRRTSSIPKMFGDDAVPAAIGKEIRLTSSIPKKLGRKYAVPAAFRKCLVMTPYQQP